MQTADFSAELGRAAGAVMNATIKSGTNSIHGAAWEFFRNDKLDASDWFEDNTTNPVKGELRLNQFGAMIGGPVIKNKLFYFGDYEGKRRVQGTSVTSQVPTALEHSSGFTNLTDILTQQAGSREDRYPGPLHPARQQFSIPEPRDSWPTARSIRFQV